MALTDVARRLSPELRTTVYYFVNFTSAGAAVAYAGIWFASKGISSGEIGVINAVPVFIMLGLNLLIGRLADRFGKLFRCSDRAIKIDRAVFVGSARCDD